MTVNFDKLNNEQREAVLAPLDAPVLVIAGAGSGKTLVLTYRIAHLIEQGVNPKRILALTFTNKAANEMKERLKNLVGDRAKGLWMGTFHSICLRLLRMYGDRLGYRKNFTIYDDYDTDKLIKDIASERGCSLSAGVLSSTISKHKSNLVSPQELSERDDYFDKQVAEIYRVYQDKLMESNAMDFDDMINNVIYLMELDTGVRNIIQNMFQYVLVDENQDTNKAQHVLLTTIAGKHKRIFAVGDDWQCLAFGSKVKLKDNNEKNVEDLEIGDLIQTVSSGKLDYAPVTNKKINSNVSPIVKIITKSGHKMKVTPSHKCFASLPEFRDKHYLYLMWRVDKGFRIGVISEESQATIASRVDQESPHRLWLLNQYDSLDKAMFEKERLSLEYKIPKVSYFCKKNDLAFSQGGLNKLFGQFGQNGRQLLDDMHYSFEHPHFMLNEHLQYVVLSLGAKEGSCLVTFVKNGQKVCKQFFSENAYKDAEEFAHKIKNEHDMAGVIEKFIVSEEQFLNVVPAIALMPTMKIPVEIDGEIQLSAIELIDICDSENTVNVEVGKTGVIVADGVVSHNSIYKFRGADIRNILGFEKDFPDSTTIKLEQNYRSTETIVSASNAVIANNQNQKKKNPWTENSFGEPISLYKAFSDNYEGMWIANEIDHLLMKGQDISEIAILYRANFQSRSVEKALLDMNIPYQIVGGLSFFQRKEIKDLMAYLKLMANNNDIVSLRRIINIPKRGIGDATIEKIMNFAKVNNITAFQAVERAEKIKGIGKRKYQLESFAELINKIDTSQGINYILQQIIDEVDYLGYLEEAFPDDCENRFENIDELMSLTQSFDAENPDSTLVDFLQEIAIQSEIDKTDMSEETVKLMTVHNAKGLEFDVVFCIGLEEGTFPHFLSIQEGEIEEERRLFYVAISRAKDKLFLSYAETRLQYGKIEEKRPSRFISEIPRELIKEI